MDDYTEKKDNSIIKATLIFGTLITVLFFGFLDKRNVGQCYQTKTTNPYENVTISRMYVHERKNGHILYTMTPHGFLEFSQEEEYGLRFREECK